MQFIWKYLEGTFSLLLVYCEFCYSILLLLRWIIIIIIIKFSDLLSVSYKPSRCLYPRPGWGKVVILEFFFLLSLVLFFHSHWQSTLKEMSCSAKCNVSYFVEVWTDKYVLNVVYSVPFLIIPFIVLNHYIWSIALYNNNNYYYFAPWEFFTWALADGLSLKFEWQQDSSSLQDSSQYSVRS